MRGPCTLALSVVLVAVLVAGCSTEPPGWPAWPADEEAARALVEAQARRPGEPLPELDADAVLEALDRASAAGALRGGWGPIAAELRAHSTIVVGVQHDSAAQIRVFARLFGPLGTADRRLLAIELFDASGRWQSLDQVSQEGDDGALSAVHERGPDALPDLRRRLSEGAYTAWKYDYLEDVLELVVAARGAGQRVMGCDLPPSFTPRLAALSEPLRLRMREVHCALALSDVPSRGPTALLFGDAHAQPEALARFLPEAPTRVHLVGGRRGSAGLEPALAARLALLDPVLVPLGARRFVLLIPDARLGAEGDRARIALAAPSVDPHLSAAALSPCDLEVGGVRRRLGEDPVEAPLSPGRHVLVVRRGELRLVAALPLDSGGFVEVLADPEARRLDLRLASPAAAPPGSLDERLPPMGGGLRF